MPNLLMTTRHPDHGQTTVEYGLCLLLAGTIALGLILWVRETGVLTDLFESVVDRLTGDL